MSGRVEKSWGEFCRILPRNASALEIQERKRAFYSGAALLLHEITNMLDPGAEPTDADIQKMNELDAELRAFFKRVAEGKV